MKKFRSPRKSFGDIDADAAATLIAATADVALVLDGKGVIRDVSFGSDDLASHMRGPLMGKTWSQTVTVESRGKVERLMREALEGDGPHWRQVNHPSNSGPDVPLLCSTVKLGDDGPMIVVGRDLRMVEKLQQRLIQAEQSIEREYERQRHSETRYRLLFHIASEAVLIVDASTQRIVEANPSAIELLSPSGKKLIGRAFPEGFEASDTDAIRERLTTVRATGKGQEYRAAMQSAKGKFLVSISLFRQESAEYFLVRLRRAGEQRNAETHAQGSRLLEVLENSPDGLVVTDLDGSVLIANRAFLDLAQLTTPDQALGQPLDQWLGRGDVDFRILLSNLRQKGSVRLFPSVLRGAYGTSTDVEVSAVSVAEGERPCLGFSIRNVASRAPGPESSGKALPHSKEQLTGLIGRVPLKDLVRDTTDVIERLCIEAALEITGGNRATAAEMLGLSRQSLYSKLRRYGLGDLDSGD